MDAIGQLAGGIAHDFNNLLTAILGNLSLIESSLPREDSNRDLLAAAERATARAANLTAQLLSFSRQAIIRSQPVDLRSSIDEVVRLLRRTIDPRIDLEIQTEQDLGTILADPAQMTQVLMNLCLNARDAMPEGGRLRLEAANVALDEADTRIRLDARCGEAPSACGSAKHRARYPGRSPATHFRAVLHHQGGGQGHWAGSGDGLRHRDTTSRLDRMHQRSGTGNAVRNLPAAGKNAVARPGFISSAGRETGRP